MSKEGSSSAMAATVNKAAVSSAVPTANTTTSVVVFLLTFPSLSDGPRQSLNTRESAATSLQNSARARVKWGETLR